MMGTEDLKRLQGKIKAALKEKRSKEEITLTFKAAGIIDHKGNLKEPYQNIYFPEEK